MKLGVLTFISAILIVVFDSVYLNMIKGYFGKQVMNVQGEAMKVNVTGAALCYVFLIFGLNYFIIRKRASVTDAFLLGLVIYGVFELTNKALFKNWWYSSVIIDTLWGGILFALVTYTTYWLDKAIK
jgi:uncharacterized membrane protein